MGARPEPTEGVSIEWYTPPGLLDALGLQFDLDPCHPEQRLPWIPAARTYSVREDGLVQPWRGRVWMNPPYGGATRVWLERFVEHGDGVALVFARTETEWFHRYALAVDAWCLIRGRLTFVHADRTPSTFNAGAPSMLMACGEACVDAVRRSELGITVAVSAAARPMQTTIWS